MSWLLSPVQTAVASIGDITDVTITSIAAEDLLVWSGSAWVNGGDNFLRHVTSTYDSADVVVSASEPGSPAKGDMWFDTNPLTYLADLVDDTTPQLGGTLDANSNTIDMGTNVLTDTALGQFITAYGWGDHSATYEPLDATLVRDDDAGYLKANWDTAYGWGDHAGVYEPIDSAIVKSDEAEIITANWDFRAGSGGLDILNTGGTVGLNMNHAGGSDFDFTFSGTTNAVFAGATNYTFDGELVLDENLTFQNIKYAKWDNAAGTPVNLLTFWSDDTFYIGSSSYRNIMRGSSNEYQGTASFNNYLRMTVGPLYLNNNVRLSGRNQADNAWKRLMYVDTSDILQMDADALGSNFGAKITTKATATGSAGLTLPHGTAPTSPVNGDMWTTTAGVYVRINGSTVGPLT